MASVLCATVLESLSCYLVSLRLVSGPFKVTFNKVIKISDISSCPTPKPQHDGQTCSSYHRSNINRLKAQEYVASGISCNCCYFTGRAEACCAVFQLDTATVLKCIGSDSQLRARQVASLLNFLSALKLLKSKIFLLMFGMTTK